MPRTDTQSDAQSIPIRYCQPAQSRALSHQLLELLLSRQCSASCCLLFARGTRAATPTTYGAPNNSQTALQTDAEEK